MRVFLTGGTGFIGAGLARALRSRGDDVVALVRAPERAEPLSAMGCTLLQGDLGDTYLIRRGVEDCDAVVHAAAVYEVGIRARDRAAMFAANVTGTETVLRASLAAGVARTVYVSTVAVFGDTHGEVAVEGAAGPDGYTSYYEETKRQAHDVACALAAEGLPLVIAAPGAVYGPHDHSQVGNLLTQLRKGRLPLVPFGDLGLTAVHRDDVVDGLVACLDKGRLGETYILGGDIVTLREILATAADVLGRKPVRRDVPARLVKAIAPAGPVLGPVLGYPPNMSELISASDGVTFWASSDKARGELGYHPRPLEQGLRDTFQAEGVPVA
jgi:dihydroflavonol-4-reductase